MAKRFSVHFSGNVEHSNCQPKGISLPPNNEFYGNASTLKTAKGYISRIKKNYTSLCPHNFRIYDMWADVDDIYKDALIYQED